MILNQMIMYLLVGRITRVRIIENKKWKTIYIDKIPNDFLKEQIVFRESDLTFNEIDSCAKYTFTS